MGNCLGLCEPFASPDRLKALRHSPAFRIAAAEAKNKRSVKANHHENHKRGRRSSKAGIVGPITVLTEATDDVKLHYDLGPELGRGQFGVIRFCTHKRAGENFACKSIAKGRLCRQKDVNDVRREIQIMKQLVGHPNIVELKDVYEDHTWVHLIMELCEGGELFDSIVHKKVFSEKEAAAICKTLMKALAYCHKRGVIHRDLKPENILLTKDSDQNEIIKLADFGLAVNIRPGEKIHGMAGSAYYIAPEVLKGEYGEEVDVWSAGVVLYILLSGLPPFWGDTEESIFNAIKFGHLDLSSNPWPSVSSAAKDLIKGMLRQEIKKRLTPEQVLNHRWIVEHTQTKDSEGPPANLRTDTMVSCSWMTETSNSFASFYSESEVKDPENCISSPGFVQSHVRDTSFWRHSQHSRSYISGAGEAKPASLEHLCSLPHMAQKYGSFQVDLNILTSATPQQALELGLSCTDFTRAGPLNHLSTIEATEAQEAIPVDIQQETFFSVRDVEQLRINCKLMDENGLSKASGSLPSVRISCSPCSLGGYIQTRVQVAC